MAPGNSEYTMLRVLARTMVIFSAAAVLMVLPARSQEMVEQESFSSPQQAVTALVAAVQENSDAELLAILGADAEDLISSGDEVADRNGRARFLKAYREKNRLEMATEEQAVLFIGSNDYPFPIPIARQEGTWVFDTRAGMEEILNRRIGRNELHTIEVLEAYTAAQREYACLKPGKADSGFALKLTSTPGKKDGLYWQAAEGEPESPFGPLIAQAAEEGYGTSIDADPPEPFHGYFFKILTRQGDHAYGGAFDYVVNGKMVLGFAMVAYPAKYGASGIMTFIVNQEGIIYEQDFGEDTARAAAGMTTFDPDETWSRYEEPEGDLEESEPDKTASPENVIKEN